MLALPEIIAPSEAVKERGSQAKWGRRLRTNVGQALSPVNSDPNDIFSPSQGAIS